MNKGDKIFVPDKKITIDRLVTGGEATVKDVLRDGSYVIMEETDDIQWHVATLERHRDEYKTKYKGLFARLYDEPFERDNLIWQKPSIAESYIDTKHICMVIGLFIDLWNWWYTRQRVQLLRNGDIWKGFKLKLSFLGVLYTVVDVDKSIPENLTERYLSQRLNTIDDALVAINLDGLMHFSSIQIGEDENKRYFLVKFIPNMPHWTWTYFIFSAIIIYIVVRLVIHFNLWTKFLDWAKPVLDAIY